ncbi:MAG: DNA methyltransferase [Pseudomonadota bacterium]|nr:DNA methyltransferase [Pseudomonadota bacterium]
MLERLLNTNHHQSTKEALSSIKESMSHNQKIADWTHILYKYPACFPPSFPRSVINSFSKPDDWIMDPFVGGGTSAVEAMVARRNFVGTDINDLAIFSSKLKTLLLTKADIRALDNWSKNLSGRNVEAEFRTGDEFYFKNVPKVVETSTRKIFAAIRQLPSRRTQNFAKGALLRLGQLEIEQRLSVTDSAHAHRVFRQILNINIEQSIKLHLELEHGSIDFIPTSGIHIANATDPGIVDIWNQNDRQFSLVLTSPPYPERHILYHKWQVNGRSETRLPYWIIESDQIENEPFYTMSSRESSASLEIYISNMMLVFENINQVMQKNGVFVQVLAFSDLKNQLPLYLAAMNEAGFEEIRNIDRSSHDGRLWREVPNRRWFNRVESRQLRCKEVVLFHRKSRSV